LLAGISLTSHFACPSISGLYSLLAPWNGGTISYKALCDRVAVTFEDVPEWMTDPNNLSSFQVELFFDGRIRITHLDVNLYWPTAGYPAVVGLSEGNAIPDDFLESDLSGYDSSCAGVHNVTQNIWYPFIQEAIDDSANGDEIVVYEGTYYEVIDFKGKAITVRSTDPYNPDVVAATVIDANGGSKTVAFESSEGPNSVLTGLTVTGGSYALYSYSAAPTITYCVLDNHNSHGVYCTGGGPALTNCTISNNGIYGINCNSCSATIESCVIEDNVGMGIYAHGSAAPTVHYNKIHGNTLDGIYLCNPASVKSNWIYDNGRDGIQTYKAGSAVIRNNTIVSNTRNAIRNSSGTGLSISNCILWDNNDDLYGCTATYTCIQNGDAGTGNFSSDPCLVDADSNDFHLGVRSPCIGVGDPNGNYSGETDIDGETRVREDSVDIGADETPWPAVAYNITSGGGYSAIQYAIDDAGSTDVIEVEQGTHYENLDFKGKAINVRSTDPNDPNVVAATIIDGNGAGNVVTFDSSEISTSVLEGLTITDGNRGIYCYYASPTIAKCVITGNTTTGNNDGAGMYNDHSDPNVLNCTFGNNEGDDGGGMGNYYSDPVVINCTFTDNNSADDGAGMWNYYSSPEVNQCVFAKNDASDGGGMWNYYSSPTVTGCDFSENTTDGYGGGGICSDGGSPIILDCVFYANQADEVGGGIYSEDCTVIVDDCVFAQNTARYDGGGIGNEGINSTSKITSCVFWANSADDGGGISNEDSDHDIINCTFFDNEADDDGGAIYNDDSDPDIVNCIFWQNTAGGSGDDIYNAGTSNPDDYDNFDDDPDFLDESTPDGNDGIWGNCDDGLNLDSTSDCIDEGDDDDAEEDYDDLDIKGSDRIINGDVDIGAYEYDSGC
jgi:parallel beta-helix repeat protein